MNQMKDYINGGGACSVKTFPKIAFTERKNECFEFIIKEHCYISVHIFPVLIQAFSTAVTVK